MIELTQEELKQHFSEPIFGQIVETADILGMEYYAVGGYVHDIFLQRPSKDVDVAVVGSGVAMAKAFGEQLRRGAYVSVFKSFGTAQVRYRGTGAELVGTRKESYQRDSRKPIIGDGTLEDDQDRRDFTINVPIVCLNKVRFGELVDPLGGLGDAEEKIIHTPLDPDVTLSDGPLHMMRCIRFVAQLGFYIDDDTFEPLCRNRERTEIISRKRTADELNKIILSSIPSKGFIDLERSGLLPLIFPESAALQGVKTRNGHSHKDNFYHTLEMPDNISKKTDNLWLCWAALPRDVAKPATRRWEPKAGWTFHNHGFTGGRMIPYAFRKMKLPVDKKMKYVQKLVNLHMCSIVIADDAATDSAVRCLSFETGDDIGNLMMLYEADITSKNMERKQRFLNNFQLVRQKLKGLEERDRVRNLQPSVSGEETMEIFGLEPRHEVKVLKSAIKDVVLDGVVPNGYGAAHAFMLERTEKMETTPIR